MSTRKISSEAQKREPIAIIGIGCRFPGNAVDPRSYWKGLVQGIDAITEVPPDRWGLEQYFHPKPGVPGRTYSRWGGFIKGIDQFEPEFFGISPREAHYIDPQQRLLLEVAWEALEDAGQVPERLAGSRTGVFVGISTSDYAHIQSSLAVQGSIDAYSATGAAFSIAANRISYCLNLRGPSIAVDTACSSSLVAMHLACQSLWRRECDLGFAGGVNMLISPGPFIAFSAASMLSPDGRCKAFDDSANGFVRGEGAGLVLLKLLSSAVQDGDPIYALIVGSAMNQDGQTKGLMIPSQTAQEAVFVEAARQASIVPSDVDYVEAHGTGTAVGDLIEARAIGNVLSFGRSKEKPCVIGSVKTSIGHLEAAAGVAGVIKVALALKHKKIPPNLHFCEPNRAIPFEDLNLRVPLTPEPWPRQSGPGIAFVNSFGIGGTNACIVMTEHEENRDTSVSPESAPRAWPFLLPLSAHTPESLKMLACSYRDLPHDTPLGSICYTAGARRTHFEHRLAVVARDWQELHERLEAFLAGEERAGMCLGRRERGRILKPAFVFCGQGPQWWGMGRELLREEPAFRNKVEECDLILRLHAKWSLMEELGRGEGSSRLEETAIAQPALFSLQVALTALWKSWGVEPEAVVGHSVGEVAAAHVAGALDLEDALRVIFHRGRSMGLVSKEGRMLAVGVPAAVAKEELRECREAVWLAAINSPSSVVLSGDPVVLQELCESFEGRGIFCRFLPVRYAFHSGWMEPIKADLLESLEGLSVKPAILSMISTVNGRPIEGAELDSGYWWRNVREEVRFAEAIDRLIESGYNTFIELGPHPVLSGSISECLHARGRKGSVLASLRRREAERSVMLGSLGTLYTLGYPVEWRKLWPQGGSVVHLPGYPWRRQRYWHESEDSVEARLGETKHPLLGRQRSSADPVWETVLDKRRLSYLEDHRLQENTLVSASVYLEMMLGVAQETFGEGDSVLEEIQFREALFLPDGKGAKIQLMLRPQEGSVAIYSQAPNSGKSWMLHSEGSVRNERIRTSCPKVDIEAIRNRLAEEVGSEDCYRRLAEIGLRFGPSYRGIERIWRRDGEALGEIGLRKELEGESPSYRFHPAFLDCCFQTLSEAVPRRDSENDRVLYVPARIERMRLSASPGRRIWSHVRVTSLNARVLEGDMRVYDQDGRLILEIDGFRCQAVGGGRVVDGKHSGGLENWFYEVRWCGKPDPESSPMSEKLPGSREIARSAKRKADRLVRELRWSDEFSRANVDLNRLSTAYALQALQELGLKFTLDDCLSLPSVMEQGRVEVEQQPFLLGLLGTLEKNGTLQRTGRDAWMVVREPPGEKPEAIWEYARSRHPAFFGEIDMITRCGSNLGPLLRGLKNPFDVFFADPSSGTSEHFYQDSPSFRIYNLVVQSVVRRALSAVTDGQSTRVLEAGGGTGGLTSHVLGALPAGRVEYVFSDPSELFLERAEQKFRDQPFMRFQPLDFERDPLLQGYEAHSFDLILASHMFRTVGDLENALNHFRGLLSSRGLAVILRAGQQSTWLSLVLGFIEGWPAFRDRAPLPGNSEPEGWKCVLERAGFVDVENISLSPDHEEPQVVTLARGPEISNGASRLSSPVDAPIEPEHEKRSWVIFADRGGVAEGLAEALRRRGDGCILVTPGPDFRCAAEDRFQIAPESPQEMERVVLDFFERAPCAERGAIYLWSLDVAVEAESSLARSGRRNVPDCLSVLAFIQTLNRTDHLDQLSRLLLVTKGAQPVGTGITRAGIGQSALVGLGRVIGNELPGLHCKVVDLDPDGSSDEVRLLLDELERGDAEDEVAFRRGRRFVPRLERARQAKVPVKKSAFEEGSAFRLEISTPGVLDGLTLRETRRREPGPGQVEIEVAAVSLNFRDVMKALALYPAEGNDCMMLGDECAGKIVSVGPGVEDFRPGDEVVALAPGCLGSHATTLASLVMQKPVDLTLEASVTMPVVFLTAHYALNHLARIRAGERVLIHAGTGGVGLAALQIARQVGAEIFATAGSPEKRQLLKLLGVGHVMDSRSLSFAEEIMESTEGRGVDVVLNSLSGDAIRKGLSCLGPHGRFLELGKRDIHMNSKLGLWAFRKNLSFFSIDLGGLMEEKPAVFRSLFREAAELISDGTFRPLPYRVFSVSQVANGFRYMAQAKHTGKIVVSMREGRAWMEPSFGEGPDFHSDATYLITGGCGGFGLVVAQWIVEKGGRNLVLVGRNGVASDEAKRAVQELEKKGVSVGVVKADVSREPELAAAISEIDRTMPPLKGIFHAAAVVDDGILLQLDPERFRNVLAPKMDGAWNLHRQTLDRELDFFVLFSSVSSLIGNPGQGNYAAANAFLDAFAHYRRSLGLPAIAVNWGRLSEVGYLSRHPRVAELLARRGVESLSPRQAVSALDLILRRKPVQVGVMDIDWQKLTQSLPMQGAQPRFSALCGEKRVPAQEREESPHARMVLAQARPEERQAILRDYIREQVAKVLGTTSSKLDPDQPLHELGLDSLMAVELKSRIEGDLGLSLSTGKMMQGPTIDRLAMDLLDQLGRAGATQTAATVSEHPFTRASISCVVPLRVHGTEPPLFCIHPAGGRVDIYKDLADRLPLDQPVYGIQSRLLCGSTEEHQSLEEMANHYARLISEQQPVGPYLLLGFSLGGFIAMAIADLLEQQGERVAFLGLVECDMKWGDASSGQHATARNLIVEMYRLIQEELGILEPLARDRLADEATRLSEEILSFSPEQRVLAIVRWLTERKYLHTNVPETDLVGYLSTFQTHVGLIENFRPAAVQAPMFIWRARESLTDTNHSDESWAVYTRQRALENTLEGTHFTVMRPPSVATLARELVESLRTVRAS